MHWSARRGCITVLIDDVSQEVQLLLLCIQLSVVLLLQFTGRLLLKDDKH